MRGNTQPGETEITATPSYLGVGSARERYDHARRPRIWATDWSDYRIDLKAPGVQKNFCCFATTKRPIRNGYTTKDLLKLVKNSEADLFIIQLSLKSRLLTI